MEDYINYCDIRYILHISSLDETIVVKHHMYDMCHFMLMFMCVCTFKGESFVHGVLSVVEEFCATPRFKNDGKNGIIISA